MPDILIAPDQSAEVIAVYADWSDLVERVRSGVTDGMEELYQLFSRGIRVYIRRQLGPQQLDDKVNAVLLVVIQAIRRGELREPEHLMGFVRNIVRKQVAAQFDVAVHGHRDPALSVPNPNRQENLDEAVAFRERTELMKQVLEGLSKKELEILTRVYLNEQNQDQICSEMSLTDTQFRLLKARAKARFVAQLRRKIIGSQEQDRFRCDPNLKPNDGETSASGNPTLDMSRILPVIAHAVAVFGDENKASHWLVTRLPLLGDRSPSELLEGRESLDLVEQILTRIEHNIPS